MKTLIVYYSRTNISRKVAEDIQKKLGGDIEEIKEIKDHNGAIGFIKGAVESVRKSEVAIEENKLNPEDYDLVVVGTPVWASTMASPVYSYLENNKDKIKKAAYFCTCGSSGYESTLENMEKLTGIKPVANLYTTKSSYDSPDYDNKIADFVEKLKE